MLICLWVCRIAPGCNRCGSAHEDWCDPVGAAPGFFAVTDRHPLERLFPTRAARYPQQADKKSKEKGRALCVGIKRC
jgi:hypothetical protein